MVLKKTKNRRSRTDDRGLEYDDMPTDYSITDEFEKSNEQIARERKKDRALLSLKETRSERKNRLISEKDAEARRAYEARFLQRRINKLKKKRVFVPSNPVEGEYTIALRKVGDNLIGYYLFDGHIEITPLSPFYVHPPHEMSLQGKTNPHPADYYFTEEGNKFFVTFESFEKPKLSKRGKPLYYDTVPTPDQVVYSVSPTGDYLATYEWSVSRVERNRLMHALNGNTVSPTSSEKGKKVCSACGKTGHNKKDCKGSMSKKSSKNSAAADMREAVKNFVAEEKAKKDVAREKEEAAPPLKTPQRISDSDDVFSFEVNHDMKINPNWVYLYILASLFPFILCLFTLDLIFWPNICALSAYAVGWLTARPFGVIVFVFLMVIENVLLGVFVFKFKKILRLFMASIHTAHIITLRRDFGHNYDTFNPIDKRPIDSSYGDRKYNMEIGNFDIREVYEIHFPAWDLSFRLGYITLQKCLKVSTSAIHLYGANITTHRTQTEMAENLRRNLSKCGKIDWDAEYMCKHNLLENTALFLDYLKKRVDSDFLKQEFRFGLTQELEIKPWWIKSRGTLALIAVNCIFALIFGPYFLVSVFNVVKAVLVSLSVPIIWITNAVTMVSQGFVQAAYAYDMPEGMMGYSVADDVFMDVDLNPTDPLKTLNFTSVNLGTPSDKKIMAVFSLFAIPGIAMPVGDRNDAYSTMAGLFHRGAALTPKVDKVWNTIKKKIVDEILDARMPRLSESDLLNFKQMLDSLSYTLNRKRDIFDWHRRRDQDYSKPTSMRETGMFNKEEPYPTYKHLRSIHAMGKSLLQSDIWGSAGRLVHTIQSYLYDVLEPSVKHLTSSEIANKMMKLGPGPKTVSDYSSYEASFKKSVKDAAQFPLYRHCTEGLGDGGRRIMNHMSWLLNRTNKVKNKYFTAEISNIKCSGDFDTALSNWFDNVATWCTVFNAKYDIHWTDSIEWFLCEGDDNITDDHGFSFDSEDFAKLGMSAKIQTNLDLSESGFCQKFVSRNGTLIGDVITFLGKRQYLPSKYANASKATKLSLARATAMSTLSQFPNAPGISEWAWRIMELTDSVVVRARHLYEAQLKNGTYTPFKTRFSKPEIMLEDRLDVSQVFGFTLAQQEHLTNALKDWEGGNLGLPLGWFPETWREFYLAYNSSLVSAPGQIQPTKTMQRLWAWFGQNLLA